MTDFAFERLANVRADIERMIPAQWTETGDREIECQPNWNLYQQFDAHNRLLLVVARQEGVLVGYMAGMVYPHPNSITNQIASIPTYFVRPGADRAMILSRMLDYALECLAGIGIFRIDMETRLDVPELQSAGRLLELKGFKPAKIGYSLKLKPAPEAKIA